MAEDNDDILDLPEESGAEPKKRGKFERIPDAEKEAIYAKLAIMIANGSSITQAAEHLGIHKNTARKFVKDPNFLKRYEDTLNEVVAPAKDKARREIARLVPKAIKVIENNLDDDNLEAAKMVLKAVGVEQEENQDKGDTNIVVQLPSLGGAPVEVESTTIELPKEVSDE